MIYFKNPNLIFCFCLKVKKGVRRKADTTTPGSNVRTLDYDPPLDVTTTIRPLRKTRAAVENAVRKQKRESMDRHTPLLKPSLSKPLEYCREIIQELLGPEHSVGFCFYILFLYFSGIFSFLVMQHFLLNV